MASDPNRPEVLLSVPNEVEAAAIVTALAEYGIEALTTGGYTSSFEALAPGYVAILVKQADLDRAKEALVEIQQQKDEVDWEKVDVMEGAEAEPPPDEVPNSGPDWSAVTVHLWWMTELLFVAICFVIWLFTRNVEALIYTIAAFGLLVALILALSRHATRRH